MSGWTWVEPFAGAAACALRLVGGRDLTPPVAWMGGKRRYARAILDAMGVPDEPPSRVLLADAGPWGWVWPLLLRPADAAAVARVLRAWAGEHPRDLWQRLAAQPPAEDLHERAAQWLWLQARAASGVPVWFSGWRPEHPCNSATWVPGGAGGAGSWVPDATRGPAWIEGDTAKITMGKLSDKRALRWEQGSGKAAPPQPIGQRSSTAPTATSGMVDPCTIAARIEATAQAFADVDVTVHHGDVRELAPPRRRSRTGGLWCYLDPPYQGATGYGWDLPRPKVLTLARRWARAGAVVAVSEAEPLDLEGWHELELTREGCKPEWLTLSREPSRLPERQADLFAPSAESSSP